MIVFLVLLLLLTAFDDRVGKERQDAANENEDDPIRRVAHHTPYAVKRKTAT